MNNFSFGNEHFQYYETLAGGTGAGKDFDGCSAVQSHMTNSRLTDPEVLELRQPVILEEFSVRIAGIQGAKRCAELLPLAHIIGVHGASVDLAIEDEGVAIEATVRTADRTGVEMEALTAVSIAALAIVDMVKGLDKSSSIENVRITAKEGGRSGSWKRPGEE